MRIAINTRFWLPGQQEGYGYFVEQVVSRLVRQHPAHQFLLLFDRPFSQTMTWPDNVQVKVIGPPARHPLLWTWWYDWRIPSVLKQFRADVFLSPDGIASLRTSVPQCLVVHDLAFLGERDWFQGSIRRFYVRQMPKFLRKVKQVATVSETSRRTLLERYGISSQKVDVVYSAAKPVFRAIGEEEKMTTKSRFTDGKEYFLYTGAIHPRKNLINLLKAFSLFKKRQQSSFKLVLAGRMAWRSGKFEQLLSTYKYRNDVVLAGYVTLGTLVQLTGAAYALVYPSLYEGFGVPVLEAMQSDVPVITSSGTSMQEIAGEAALYADPADPASLAEQLNRIYIDEAMRRRLIEQGSRVVGRYTWEDTAERLWSSICKAAQRD